MSLEQYGCDASNRAEPYSVNIGLYAHMHHRLLVKEIGRPLKSFKSTLELCTSLMDALESHSAAYENAGVIHRDISGGNILINEDGRGGLIDWDMCVQPENEERAERTGQNMGTWAYMSAGLLMGQEQRPHLLRDDLESFVHVLYYHVFRYRPTFPAGSPWQRELFDTMERVFNTTRQTTCGYQSGSGLRKCLYLRSPVHFDPEMMQEYMRPVPLVELMLSARETFEPIYVCKPIVDESWDEEQVALDRECLADYHESYEFALEQLGSSVYLITLFRMMVIDCDPTRFAWPPADGAVDQFPLPRACRDPLPTPAPLTGSRKRSVGSIDGVGTPNEKIQRLASGHSVSVEASACTSTHAAQT